MKLEVGMYVRIQWGNGVQTISKCTNKVDIGDTQYSNNDFYIHTDKKGEVIYKSMILKVSHNIIDLIEEEDVLDYEFGGIISKSEVIKEDNELGIGWDDDGDFINLESLYINSIVTKEQFESMSYKVGE